MDIKEVLKKLSTFKKESDTSSDNIDHGIKYENRSETIVLTNLPSASTLTKSSAAAVAASSTFSTSLEMDYIARKAVGILLDQIRMSPIESRQKSQRFTIEDCEKYDKNEHTSEINLYKVENLNRDQLEIWNYVKSNKDKIILLQAGPGRGKSFVLKSIAYNLPNIKFDTIIYKNDLLATFKYNSRRFTVAKFVMKTLNLGYFQYKAFDKLLSSKISAYDFILVIVSMLKRAKLPNMSDGIVFIDEYTIISKPILLMTLILFEHYKIGAIVCGDKNQLQNIYNSRHAPLSSYKLAASFASRQFELYKNERCSDENYNELIDYISQFSSNKRLDPFAFAIISAIFLKQLIEPPNYNHTHLAGTHQELSDLTHTLVCNNQYPVEFYSIDQSKLRDKDFVVQAKPTLQPTQALIDYLDRINNNQAPRVDKFLPYIPLVIGARYYVFKHSEYSQGTLNAINLDGTLEIIMDSGGEVILVSRNSNDSAIFEQHRDFLLNGMPGKIYGYPIYPANFLSIHKCQGCTMSNNLDLLLNNTVFSGVYVALSRVIRPEQIARITIPDQISYIVSTIINFPQHVYNKPITVQDLKDGLTNYVFYDVSRDMVPFGSLISDYILKTDVETRQIARSKIIDLAKGYPQNIVKVDDSPFNDSSNLLTMSLIIKYRSIFLALACLDEIDRNVWTHEFLLANTEMAHLLPSDFRPNSKSMSDIECRELNELVKMAGLHSGYAMEISTMEYIKSKSVSAIRMEKWDRDARAKFVIEKVQEYVFMESTEFCAKIYSKLKNGDQITESWLIDELNVLTSQNTNATTAEPTKKRPRNEELFKILKKNKTSRPSNATTTTTKPIKNETI